jgi:lipopolysaccharide transport system permease protein
MDELIIEAGRTERQYWRDLWRYRELFFILAWRDVVVRYKQTVAGVAWAVVQPALSITIMTLTFGKLAGLPSQGVPYPILVCAAMLPWQFFSNALTNSSQSIVSNANLISKIYFPRFIIPAGSIVVSLIDLFVASSILVTLMIWYHFWPTWRLLVLPALVMLAAIAAIGPGLILTALTVRYRDFRIIIPFIVQLGMLASPVGYSASFVREKFGPEWFQLYSINPLVGVIDGFRWAILGGQQDIYWPGFTISLVLTLVFFFGGIYYFRKTERTFADTI